MSGEKYKQISTILKYQSSSVSTSFPPLRARGKKKKRGKKRTLLELFLRSSIPFRSSDMKRAKVEGKEAGREEILVNVMQLMLASEAVEIVLLPGKASIPVVSVCQTSYIFVRLNARRSFSPPSPCGSIS